MFTQTTSSCTEGEVIGYHLKGTLLGRSKQCWGELNSVGAK